MRTDTLQLASELAGRSEAFALATVVRREPPSSARVGDSAVVTPDGEFHGWLGGSCTRPTVIREALAALADGAPRLIGIVRDPGSASGARPGLTVFPMACHSGGSVEIYIEPLLPARRLLIFGVSPTARALARLAAVLDYRVEAVDPEASETLFPDASRLVTSDDSVEPPGSGQDAARCFAVVATLGQRDEEAAWAASRLVPAYVGVVASRKRFGKIRETLAARGATAEQLDRIANPAGLDIGAQTPEEIALSILAEITRRARAGRRRREGDRRPAHDSAPPVPARRTEQAPAAAGAAIAREPGPAGAPASPAPATRIEKAPAPAAAITESTRDPAPPAAIPETARDPVCGMSVAATAAGHQADFGGTTYHFCCAHCREQFLAEPRKYAAAAQEG
ncbi:MAG: XdhC family protein [Acidobacteria bacterium]|nr:XdhC family protein [Acidobacteriota bacterium]